MWRLLRSWLRALVCRDALERQMAEELRFHLEARADDLMKAGLSRNAAHRRARLEFGSVETSKDAIRRTRGLRWIDELRGDIRYALRTFRRGPIFATVAILSLALGIGANTAVFHLLDVVRFRPLPIARPSELVKVRVRGGNGGMGVINGANSDLTYPLWEQIRDRQRAFSGAFAWGDGQSRLGEGIEARGVRVLWVSGEYFPVIGVAAAHGRVLGPADDRRGCANPGVVLSDPFWKRELGGRDDAIGRTLTIGGRRLEVIGITPPSFHGLEIGRTFDVALPLCLRAETIEARHVWWLVVMGRLRPGWSVEQTSAHVAAWSAAAFDATVPTGYAADDKLERYRKLRLEAVSASNGVSSLRKEYDRSLWVVLAMAGTVLLIACANLANLMVARASTRTREFAVRLALGASRSRLIRQLLCESVLLSLVGTIAGFALAWMLSHTLVQALSDSDSALVLDMSMDWAVFVFATVLGLLTSILVGLSAALRSSAAQPGAALKADGRGATNGRERFSLQRLLVTAQIAMSLVLIVGALLMVQTFRNLTMLDPGFKTRGLLVLLTDMSALQLPIERRGPVSRDLLAHLAKLPNVESVATTSNIPLYGSSWTMSIRIVDNPDGARGSSKVTWVSHTYLDTMQMPIVAGRALDEHDDREGAARVAVVNQTFAQRLFGNASPIGHVFQTGQEPGYPAALYEIVGVVRDSKYGSLRQDIQPNAFAPAAQHPNRQQGAAILMRVSDVANETFYTTLRRHVAAFDPRIAMQIGDYDADIRASLIQERLMATLSGFFGQLALSIAALGLYGVISYIVAARRREFGIRIALGATRSSVLQMVLRQSIVMIAAGILIGTAVAVGATRALSTLMFGVTPQDPAVIAMAILLLAATGIAAAVIPARRAAHVDPIDALRE